MRLLGRIMDAVRMIFGMSESQAEMRRIRRDWLGIQLDIDIEMEKVNALVARIAKRTKREASSVFETPIDRQPVAPIGAKDAIRHRIRARRSGVQVAVPETSNGGEE